MIMSVSNEAYMPVTVEDEANNRTITINMRVSDYQRAVIDSNYLNELMSRATPPNAPDDDQAAAAVEETGEENAGAGPNLFIWNDQTVLLLLALYEEKKEQFNTKRHKKVFDDIANAIMETNPAIRLTGGQCQSKINSLKKTFKNILDHNKKSGNDRATWAFFDRMNEIFGATGWANPVATASEAGPGTATPNPEAVTEPKKKKRKLDAIFEDFFEEKKKLMAQRNEIRQQESKKLLQQRETQHKEKMDILKELLNRTR